MLIVLALGGLNHYQIKCLNKLLRNKKAGKKQSEKRVKNEWKMMQKQGRSCFRIVKKTGPFFRDVEKRHQKMTSKKSRKWPKNATVKRPIVRSVDQTNAELLLGAGGQESPVRFDGICRSSRPCSPGGSYQNKVEYCIFFRYTLILSGYY